MPSRKFALRRKANVTAFCSAVLSGRHRANHSNPSVRCIPHIAIAAATAGGSKAPSPTTARRPVAPENCAWIYGSAKESRELSNRNTVRLEFLVSARKQRNRPGSNRNSFRVLRTRFLELGAQCIGRRSSGPSGSVRRTAGVWPWPLKTLECRLRWCIGFSAPQRR